MNNNLQKYNVKKENCQKRKNISIWKNKKNK